MSGNDLLAGLPPAILYVAERFGTPVGVGWTPAEACAAAEAHGVRRVDRITRYSADDPELGRLRRAAAGPHPPDLDVLRGRVAEVEAYLDGEVLMRGVDDEELAELDGLREELRAEEYRAAHPSLWGSPPTGIHLHVGNPPGGAP